LPQPRFEPSPSVDPKSIGIGRVYEWLPKNGLHYTSNGHRTNERDARIVHCPATDHRDEHPSTKLHLGLNVFHCFSCGAGGGILDMIVAAGVVDLKARQKCTINDDVANNSVVIAFEAKPKQETLDALRKAGFKWSRDLVGHSRVRSDAAIDAARQLVAQLPEEPQSPRAGAMRWLEAQVGVTHDYVLREHAKPKPHQIRGKKLKDEEQTATFFYTDELGTILYRVVRIEGRDEDGKPGKRFEAHALRKGKWLRGMFGQAPVPYHLPDIELARATGRPLIMIEGERDADWLRSLGFLATSTPFGAGFNIRPDWRPYFEGITFLALIGDGDHAGRRAVARRAQALEGTADAIAVIDPWPDHIDDGYDTTDLINELFADGYDEAEIAAQVERRFFGASAEQPPTPLPLRSPATLPALVA
jgi:hypothetical protein